MIQSPKLNESRIAWYHLLPRDSRWSALVSTGSTPERVARGNAGLAFVAAPYQSEVQIDGQWQSERSTHLSILAALEMLKLHNAGVSAICPSLQMAEMCHALSLLDEAPDPLDPHRWKGWAWPMLHAAKLVVVPQLPGWEKCPVIWAQALWALERNIPIHLYAEAA